MSKRTFLPTGFVPARPSLKDLQDVAEDLAPATNDVLTYDGVEWDAAPGSAGYSDEQVRDVMGAALVAGTGITVTPNDLADTITVANTITSLDALSDAAISAPATGQTLRYNGSNFVNANSDSTMNVIIDGSGSAITTGVKCDVVVDFACTIISHDLLADASGSIVIDIWKDSYANYPPTVADTITASDKPTLSSATKATDSTLTGWTTSISAGDTLRFNVDSVATVTRIVLALKIRRT